MSNTILDFENRKHTIVHSKVASFGYKQSSEHPFFNRRDTMESNVQSVVDALSSRRINTLTELRRMERILVATVQPHVRDQRDHPLVTLLANAWLNYVENNNLLSELRNLTRDYPFSSELLDEAKELVKADPDRGRSWNFAWLALVKIEEK